MIPSGTGGDPELIAASQGSAAGKRQVQHRVRSRVLPKTAFPFHRCKPVPGWGAKCRGSCGNGSKTLSSYLGSETWSSTHRDRNQPMSGTGNRMELSSARGSEMEIHTEVSNVEYVY